MPKYARKNRASLKSGHAADACMIMPKPVAELRSTKSGRNNDDGFMTHMPNVNWRKTFGGITL
jgi:hypothetical protein